MTEDKKTEDVGEEKTKEYIDKINENAEQLISMMEALSNKSEEEINKIYDETTKIKK